MPVGKGDKKMERKIDGYIQPHFTNGKQDYTMYLHYDGTEFCFLNKSEEAQNFAKYFKRKIKGSKEGFLYTDIHGWTKMESNPDSVLATITGIDNIKNALITLINASENLDIQSDLTVHINKNIYPLVRDVDDEHYFARDTMQFSKKGYDIDSLVAATEKLDQLEQVKNDSYKKMISI